MDFHSLVRKDLQALCKLNKIPANRTNVAMAEALSSLHFVKGIENFFKSTESSVVESSVESPEKDVVTSPKTTRTGRRKKVREGSGVVQSVTPVTRRKNRVPVASVKTVQRVYNTRLSARLSRKILMESEKKEHVEAVKISSYCDGVSVNDFGEVSDDKSVPGYDNVVVDSSIPEIEQQNGSVLWKNASKDLDLKDRSATNMKSEVLENIDEGFQILEMPSLSNMAVVDLPLYQKKDDAGIGLCLSETDNITEVIPSEVKVFEKDANKAETPTSEWKAAIPFLSPQEKGSADVGFSYLTNKIQIGTSKRGNGDDLDAQITALTDMKAVDLNGKGSDNVDVDFFLSEIEQQSEPPNSVYADRYLDLKDIADTNSKSEMLIDKVKVFEMDANKAETPTSDRKASIPNPSPQEKRSDNVHDDFSLFETEQRSESWNSKYADRYLDLKDTTCTNSGSGVLIHKVKVFEMDADKAETLTSDRKAAIPIPSPQEKGSDNVDVDFSLSEIEQRSESRNSKYADRYLDLKDTAATNSESEVLINKGFGNVGVDSSVLEIEQQSESLKWKSVSKDLDSKETAATTLESRVPEKTGSDGVGVHFSFSERSDDVEVHFSFSEADANVDAAVTRSTDRNERENLKDHSNTESNEKVNCVECVHDMMIHPKSEKVIFEGWSSGANNFVDGENFDISVKIQEDIRCISESGGDYDNEKGLASQEEISGKAIASYMYIYSESNENSENSIYNNSGDCTSVDTEFFQPSVYSKQSESQRKTVSEILSCNGALEFADQLEMTSSIEATNDFSGRVPFDDELGDKVGFADEPELKCKSASKDLDLKETAATTLESSVPEKNVEGFKMDAVEAVVEMPSHENMSVFDMLLHKKKDDGGVGLPLLEIDMATEVLANEVELLPMDTEKTGIEMPFQKTKVVEQGFSLQKEWSNDVGVHFSFPERSDDVEVHFSFLEADAIVAPDSNEKESLIDHSNMESSGEVNYVECVHDKIIQPKSEKVMFECRSSAANNFVDGDNFYVSVKIQEEISCNSESGGDYDNEKGLASQEEISGKAIASDMHIYSESNEKIENSIYNNFGDDTSVDTDFFQHSVYSKKSDSKRKTVSGVLSCNGAVEFADQLEITGSIVATNDFSGGVSFVDKLGDKDDLADDPESNSKTSVKNSCDTKAESDFLEYVICCKQDQKRESIASQILGSSCTREPADQSETLDSADQLVSGKSITKESRILVASDISSCCLGNKKLSFDESQQASEVKSPSSLKLSGQIYPSSAPPSLQSRRTKITYGEPPLILADYPFTQKVLCGSERSLGPCHFANISNYTPMPVSSTTSGPTPKLMSNVSEDKENIEHI